MDNDDLLYSMTDAYRRRRLRLFVGRPAARRSASPIFAVIMFLGLLAQLVVVRFDKLDDRLWIGLAPDIAAPNQWRVMRKRSLLFAVGHEGRGNRQDGGMSTVLDKRDERRTFLPQRRRRMAPRGLQYPHCLIVRAVGIGNDRAEKAKGPTLFVQAVQGPRHAEFFRWQAELTQICAIGLIEFDHAVVSATIVPSDVTLVSDIEELIVRTQKGIG